jgi:serine/threonine-protein kinase
MRHVVFYAELPKEVEPAPPAAPAPPSPLPEEVPQIAAPPSGPPQEEAPEPAAPPERLASARAPEPAPPPPPPEPISVSINATPWATIEIDGEEIGVTPMANVPLAPGDRQFRVIMPDGTVLEQVVRIAPDNRHIAFP